MLLLDGLFSLREQSDKGRTCQSKNKDVLLVTTIEYFVTTEQLPK